ncbi:unnamed protein product [Spodoptera exigua]|nr:unnamed protein product [Spodoptera exigua]
MVARRLRHPFSMHESAESKPGKYQYFLLYIDLGIHTSRISNASGDACERRDPCQHGGVCISTDDGPICECRDGDYEGAFCERASL